MYSKDVFDEMLDNFVIDFDILYERYHFQLKDKRVGIEIMGC